MRQGTTPAYTINVSGYDLTDKSVFVTIKGRGKTVTLMNSRLSIAYSGGVTAIAFVLTQEETLALPCGQAEVQVRFIGADGTSKATNIAPITVERILLPGVIAYNLHRLQSITVTPPDKRDYSPGELMDWTGVKVVANYTDGKSADVTNECTYDPENGTPMTAIMIARGVQVTYSEGGITHYYVIPLEEIV